MVLLPILLAMAGFLQWLLAHSADPWDDFLVWPVLLYAGSLITRIWPLLFLSEDN